MKREELDTMISQAAEFMPPASLHQPENELFPDPAKLRARIEMLEARLDFVERWALAMDTNFQTPFVRAFNVGR